jgi:hypothetical protein
VCVTFRWATQRKALAAHPVVLNDRIVVAGLLGGVRGPNHQAGPANPHRTTGHVLQKPEAIHRHDGAEESLGIREVKECPEATGHHHNPRTLAIVTHLSGTVPRRITSSPRHVPSLREDLTTRWTASSRSSGTGAQRNVT